MKQNNLLKRVCACFLALSLLVGLTACGAPAASSAPSASAAGSGDAGAASSTGGDRAPVELKWYVGGYGPQADLESVLAEANKYLTEKLNCTLKIIETDFGSYDQKMQMTIASQEEFDLCFTSSWTNNYYNNVNRSAFLEMDELLDKYAPDLKALMPEAGWEAAKVNGVIYGVPNMQIWARTNAMVLTKEAAEKYSFDTNGQKNLKDFEPLLAAAKQDNPSGFPLSHYKGGLLNFMALNFGYDELVGQNIPGVILFEDDSMKVINQFELPALQEHFETMYDWNKKGYFRPDASAINDGDALAEVKAGKNIMRTTGTLKPGLESVEKEIFGGRDIVLVPMSEAWLSTSGITATMTSISRTSKNPERAMEFLNLFNTDPYLYNLITQGIEGKHYENLGDGYIKPIENSGYFPNADWMYGNQFLAYFKEGQEKTVWDETMALNANAKTSPAIGFAFDPTSVQNEIAAVNAVVQEFAVSLDTGSIDPATGLAQFNEKLKQAGSEIIVAEVQKQLDAWKAG